jgi:hypothetical protein
MRLLNIRFWWFTLPVAFMTLIWILPALHTYSSFVLRHPEPYTDTTMNSRVILLSRINTLLEKFRILPLKGDHKLDVIDFDTFKLTVPSAGLVRLDANLPQSKTQKIPAKVYFPGEVFERKVKVRYRGDNLHHWGFPTNSWNIRLPKEETIQGQRTFNLIVPRWRATTSYYLPLKAAKLLNVLSSESRFVNLEVNGHQHGGLHLLTESIDEGFLRRHSRLPGDIYFGDMVLSDGLPREQMHSLTLWQLPGAWRKAAHNNKFELDSYEPLKDLLTDLANNSDPVSHERLISRLNLEAWARLSAWQKLMGASHLDDGHNWVLYYDYVKETIEPILRDGNALDDNLDEIPRITSSLDVSLSNVLLSALHRDHRFLRLKHRTIVDFFADQKDKELFRDFDELVPRVATALQRSQQMDWLEMPNGKPLRYFTSEEFQERAIKYRKKLESWFNSQRVIVTLQSENISFSHKTPHRLLFEINGYAPVDELTLPIKRTKNNIVSICLRLAENHTCKILTRKYSSTKDTLLIKLPLFAELTTESQDHTKNSSFLMSKPRTYEFVIDGAIFDSSRSVIANGYRNNPFNVRENNSINISKKNLIASGIIPIDHPTTRWQGEVYVNETSTFEGDLVIEPGTRVMLAPGANLFIRGRLIAEGLSGKPILFTRQDSSKPWGTIAIIGPRSDGSRIKHSSFIGGSGFKDHTREYSGMVEIRSSNDVIIESTIFMDNSSFDDMLHITYSKVILKDVTIKNAIFDAIDIDISTVHIDRLRSSNSGNDGLDLMTSDVFVKNSQISRSLDKGISVGEGSLLLLENSTISNNLKGIEGKDGSLIYILNSQIKENSLSISGYRKNSSYPGNVKIILENTEADLRGDKVRLIDGSELKETSTINPEKDKFFMGNIQKRTEDLRQKFKENKF